MICKLKLESLANYIDVSYTFWQGKPLNGGGQGSLRM